MKKSIFQAIFKGIYFVLLTMITTNGMAQYDHLSKEQKEQKSIELINEAEAFVLGTPVDSECFYGSNGKTIYTKIIIKVKHWYKGKGNRIISIVRKGGVIGSDNQIPIHRYGPSIYKNIDYFMLINKTKDGNYEFVEPNSKASFGRYSDSRYDDFEIIAFYGMKFNSHDDFNSFIKNMQGIKTSDKKKMLVFKKV